VKHVNWALLENAKFVVSQAGRNRVLKEKQKNVHAVVRGNLVDCKLEKAPWPWRVLLESMPLRRVSYNPYRKAAFFLVDTEKSVKSSSLVHFGSDMMVHADLA
jgi:ribosome maturation protein Sdo1